MSQYRKGSGLLMNSLIIFIIAALVTLTIIIVLSTGIGSIGDQATGLLTNN